jgi:hypothetical protein
VQPAKAVSGIFKQNEGLRSYSLADNFETEQLAKYLEQLDLEKVKQSYADVLSRRRQKKAPGLGQRIVQHLRKYT